MSPARSPPRSTVRASSASRPGVRIMALKFIEGSSSCGTGDMAHRRDRLRRLVRRADHQRLVGRPEPSTPLEAAIFDAERDSFVAAAGNQGSNMDGGGPKSYPAASPNANILSVACDRPERPARDVLELRRDSVDIVGPGRNILSTLPGERLTGFVEAAPRWRRRTSPASRPSRSASWTSTPDADRAACTASCATGVPLAATAGKTATGRLVNALRAIDVVGPVAAPIDRHGINVGSDRRLDRQHDHDLAGRDRCRSAASRATSSSAA